MPSLPLVRLDRTGVSTRWVASKCAVLSALTDRIKGARAGFIAEARAVEPRSFPIPVACNVP